MADQIPQIDLKPIQDSLKELDKKLVEMNRIGKMFETDMQQKNRDAGAKEIGTMSLAVYGAVVLGLWTLVKDDASVKAALEGLSTALQTFGSTVAPIFVTVIELLTGLINAFNSLPEPVKQVILVSFMIVGALFGMLSLIIPLIAAWSSIAAAAGTFAAAALPVIGIVAGIIIGIGLLIAALIYAYTHFEGFRNLVNTVWTSIQSGLAALWGVIQPALMAIADFFIAQWQRVVTWWNTMLPTFMTIWNAIWTFLQPIIAVIVQYLQTSFEIIKTIFVAAWEIIKAVIVTAWGIIKAVISAAIGVITSIISAFAYLLTGQWGKAWQAVLNIFKNIGGMLVSVVGSVINGILSIISSLIGLVGGIFSSMWSGALNITGKLLGGISDKITSFCSQAASWGANLINEFISGIRSRIQGVINAVSDVVGSVKDFLGFSSPTKKGPGSYADQWAPNFMEMFIGGIQAGIPAMKSIALKSVSQLSVMGQSQTASELSLAGSDQSAPMIRIDQMHVRNDQDIRLISQELWRLHQRQARSFGGNV